MIMVLAAAFSHFDEDETSVTGANTMIVSLDQHTVAPSDFAVGQSGHCVSGASCSGAVIPEMQEIALPITERSEADAAVRETFGSGQTPAPMFHPPRQPHIV